MDVLQRSYAYGRSPLTPHSGSKPYRTYLFGSSISTSLSPKVLNSVYKAHGISWNYLLYQTTDPEEYRRAIHDPNVIGSSITMPNKLTFRQVLDDVTEEAKAIGAVNTSFVRLDDQGRRRFIGTNTDWIGVRDTLNGTPNIKEKAWNRPSMVLGSGGAARSSIYALWTSFEPSEIYVVNRLKSEVDDMIQGLQASIPGIKLRHVDTLEAARNLAPPTITVGTIPDIYPASADEILTWRVTQALILRSGRDAVVLDMCYSPNPTTRLVRFGKDHGATVYTGDEVVVRVCMGQAVLWLERPIDDDVVASVMRSVTGSRTKL